MIDVAALDGIEDNGYLIGWDDWQSLGGAATAANIYGGANATVWWDWEERIW